MTGPRLVAATEAGVDDRGGVDYAAAFDAFPTPCALLGTDLVIREVNSAYLAITGRPRCSLLGRSLFEAFPDHDPSTAASDNVRRVLQQAMRTGKAAVMGAQRYDISPQDDPAGYQVRYWTTTAVPIVDQGGEVSALLYNVHDVTALTQSADAATAAGHPRVRDLFRAAVEVTEQARLFDDTVIAERQLGLAVQDAMLPRQVPTQLSDRVVVRYRPASHVLHVGGDWYDVTQLDEGRFAVAVGDVVGHGLNAAVVMGQLRSALNALTLADLGPAAALSCLDRCASQDDDAAVSTAVKVIVDQNERTLTYSSAGHPPGILVHPDGTAHLLDQAAGAALALPDHTGPRPTATTRYPVGARLLLYTDGLVERRAEDIEASIAGLARRVRASLHLAVDTVADHLLDAVPSDHHDDVALLVVQL